MSKGRKATTSRDEPASCRVCGCTDDDCRQCIEKIGEACHWVEPYLCSACVRSPEVLRMYERCRYKPCRLPAMSGAFTFPLDPPVDGKRWGFTLLCVHHGFAAVSKGARHMSWRPRPDERAQGTAEHELRQGHPEIRTARTHRVWAGARAELRRQGNSCPTNAEITSEAIEAAEALGL